ncbi:MAG: glutamate 5-kinase [Candidatus Omnitrophica bacterium]|nr:glutamate 5-kinase [Candidatus Omnitrophota bacterium]
MKPKRLVIKVGTSLLTNQNKRLDRRCVRRIVSGVVRVREMGYQVVLVSSGAVGAGMGLLGLHHRPRALDKLQAAAALGQGHLMRIYDELFHEAGLRTGQILLTQEGVQDRRRYLNARNTLLALLDYGAVPIVNENDSVSTEEIRFGDNDVLSALVANLAEASLLVILSDVDGLYTSQGRDRSLISRVEHITPEIEAVAGGTRKSSAVGGMTTKILAAKVATSSGIPCIIANGRRSSTVLQNILEGKEVGTYFVASERGIMGKKRWVAYASKVAGRIRVDAGAQKALAEGDKSLLPSGISGVEGNFKLGDVVSVLGPCGEEFARGLSNYSAEEMAQIKGLKSGQLEGVLGRVAYAEAIHRDNLVILSK